MALIRHTVATLLFKRVGLLRFLNVFKEDSYAHPGLFFLIKNRVKTEILWNIITIYNPFLC